MTDRITELAALAERIKACETDADALGLETVAFFMAMALKQHDDRSASN